MAPTDAKAQHELYNDNSIKIHFFFQRNKKTYPQTPWSLTPVT